MGKGKPRWQKEKPYTFISCRSVGPGGTTITMYREGDMVKCVWQNENCPYSSEEETTEELINVHVASDGHNVSFISLDDLRKLLEDD